MTQDPRTLRRLSEAYLDQQVLGIATVNGWKAAHCRDSRKVLVGDPGQPDWLLARYGITIHIECKTEEGTLSPAQKEWLEALGWPGFEHQWDAWWSSPDRQVRAYVVRPSDWDERRVHQVLR